MPTLDRVKAFIARVEALDHLGAISDFYHPDAAMQENFGPRREGMEALLAGEAAALKRMGGPPASTCRRFAIDGDTVFINWIFQMGPGEPRRAFDEISVQTWRDDRIAEERFYYDPGQMK